MTTPREPDGRYDRGGYDRGGYDDEGAPTWGGAPAGGWGAAPDGRDDRYPADRYEDDRYEGDRYAGDRYEDDRYGDDRYGSGYGSGSDVGRPSPGYDDRGGRYASDWGSPEPIGRARRAPDDDGRRSAPAWAQDLPSAARRPGRNARRRPWVAVGVALAVVVAVLVLGFVTPGWFVSRVFDAEAVQTGVSKILTEDYGTDGVADVRCPENVAVAAGATFTCDATIDADPVKVPVRVTDADGGYEVGRPT